MPSEKAITLSLGYTQLLSVLHQADKASDVAVLVIVGGPQYRVGSHRQFIQLARSLASKGIHAMRFDYRGMGDSQGSKKEFDDVDTDVKTAIDTLTTELPLVRRVVLWGLCDAASAALIYACKDDRVDGVVLLNPWLKSEQAQAKTMVKHYYIKRLLSFSFWKKLLLGKVNISQSAKEAKGFVQDSVAKVEQPEASYQHRMLEGLRNFKGKVGLILSAEDLTAKEFEQQVNDNKDWRVLVKNKCQITRIAGADHTFSSAVFKREVEEETYRFITNTVK